MSGLIRSGARTSPTSVWPEALPTWWPWFAALPESATVIFDYGTDWDLLAFAVPGRPKKNPPTDFATPLFLDGHPITHPLFEQAQALVYTLEWPEHHALADARALMAGYRAWRPFMDKIWKIQ